MKPEHPKTSTNVAPPKPSNGLSNDPATQREAKADHKPPGSTSPATWGAK